MTGKNTFHQVSSIHHFQTGLMNTSRNLVQETSGALSEIVFVAICCRDLSEICWMIR